MEKSITFQLWQIPGERQFLSFPSYGEVAPRPAYRITPVDTYMLSYIVSGKGAVLSEDGIVSVGAGEFCCIRRDAEVICRADFDDPYAVRWFFYNNAAPSAARFPLRPVRSAAGLCHALCRRRHFQ